MKNVVTNKIFSGRQYIELLTDKYLVNGGDTQIEIEDFLALSGFEGLWNFPLDGINEAIENDRRVVLVQCCKEENYTDYEYRWFELPDHMTDEDVENFIKNEF